ncbi:MAG: hypothetical protein QXW62_05805 [Candidatus Methanomethylicaceae archaeon]|nr:hypothetical protein [Candidatus Verstraetearchaeota archaeon]
MAKGISEIIAILMMIIIVSSISVIIYSYSVGFLTGVTSIFGERTRIDIISMKEKFVIVDVFVEVLSNNSIVSVAVYNYGKVDVILHQMFINGTKAEVEEIKLAPNNVVWFNGSVPILLSNSTFYLRIVTKMGNFYEVLVS